MAPTEVPPAIGSACEPPGADERHVLPDGQVVFHRNRYETEFLWREIFVDRVYARNVVLPADARVIDVGGNIGLFSLFIKQVAPQAQICLFEPVPQLIRLAKLNLERFGADVECFPLGLSDSESERLFTYYPGYSLLSGFHADVEADRYTLSDAIRAQLTAAASGRPITKEMVDALIGRKLDGAVQTSIPMTTLSSVIRRCGLDRIDLVKIDAERSELEILRGVRAEDWELVRQIIVEAHSLEIAEELERMLGGLGYRVVVEARAGLGSELLNLYATRSIA